MSPAIKSRRFYPPLLLGAVALLCAATLTLGNALTEKPIAERQAEDLNNSLAQVLPKELHDNDIAGDTQSVDGKKVYIARKDGQVSAVAFQSVSPGYSGDIVLIMAVDRDGVILGVRVVRHTETPGLGDKIEAKKGPWIDGFSRKSLTNPDAKGWQVKKDGGIFDQFTGATITPRAVVKGVHDGLQFFAAHRTALLAAPQPTTTAEANHGK